MKNSRALSELRRSLSGPIVRFPAKFLADSGLSPNALTIMGFVLAAGAGAVAALGYLLVAGLLVLASGAADLLDGTVARLSGKSTKSGALLDSTLDRFAEAALFVGLLAYFADRGSVQEMALVGAALAGSMMTSYVRARAEGLGLKCEVGFFTRPERVILLALGLLLGAWPVVLLVVLWIVAVLSNLTAWQRLYHTWHELEKSSQ